MTEPCRWPLRSLAAIACFAALVARDAGIANAQATPKRGGTAVIGVSVAGATLTRQLTSSRTALTIFVLWASGIDKYDKNGDKKPQSASSWDFGKDGKSPAFHLRPVVKWSDGH